MKYCKKCNKVYPENAKFCPACGELLEESIHTDIFGDIMDDRISKIENNHDNNLIDDGNEDYCIYNDKDPVNKIKNIALISTIISCIVWLAPILGQAYTLITAINNFRLVSKKLIPKKYLIISIAMIILSMVWFILLVYFNVFEELLEEYQ